MKPFHVRSIIVRLIAMSSLAFAPLLMQTAEPARAIGNIAQIDARCKPGDPGFLEYDLQIRITPTQNVYDAPSPDGSYGDRVEFACKQYWRVEIAEARGRNVKIRPLWDANSLPRKKKECLNTYLNYFVWAPDDNIIYRPIGGGVLYGTWEKKRKQCAWKADNPSTKEIETGSEAVIVLNSPYFYFEVKAEAVDASCPSGRCTKPVTIRVIALPPASSSSATGQETAFEEGAADAVLHTDSPQLDDVNSESELSE